MAAASGLTAGPVQAVEPEPFRPRGRLARRPNFLVIVVDEMRAAPVYESAALKQWRRKELATITALSQQAMSFENHHVMSCACAPSRASFFTGQYPSRMQGKPAVSASEADGQGLQTTAVDNIVS